MDDLKISHQTDAAITDIVTYLEKIDSTLTASRGDKHQYLSMGIDYSARGKVKVSMKQFTKKILTEFPDPLKKRQSRRLAIHFSASETMTTNVDAH